MEFLSLSGLGANTMFKISHFTAEPQRISIDYETSRCQFHKIPIQHLSLIIT